MIQLSLMLVGFNALLAILYLLVRDMLTVINTVVIIGVAFMLSAIVFIVGGTTSLYLAVVANLVVAFLGIITIVIEGVLDSTTGIVVSGYVISLLFNSAILYSMVML